MRVIYFFFFFSASLISGGCVKTNSPQGSAALNIVNAINYSDPIVTNFTQINSKSPEGPALQYFATANQIGYCSSWESGSYVGPTFLSISQISDTLAYLWSGELNLNPGGIYSLFFCGDTTSVDTLLTSDKVPYYSISDSSAGIRFVNLVKGSLPMSVNMQGNLPSQFEFSSLGYKEMSNFKPYNANSSGPGSYAFEIRDQNSDSLLAVYYWSYILQRNNTVFIAGSRDLGINAYQLNNF